MYIDVKMDLEMKSTREIEWYVKSQLPNMVNEILFKNPEELNKIIKKSVEGQFRAIANEILQSKDFKEFMIEKIWQELKK